MKATNESRRGRSGGKKSTGATPIVKPAKPKAMQAWLQIGKTCLKVGSLGILFCAFYVAVWSSGASPVPVSGTVRYQGQPLANVTVVCLGKGNSVATGKTDDQGRFAFLTTEKPGDGAFPGEYSVAIAPGGKSSSDSASPSYDSPTAPPYPTRYLSADTSPLTISVQADGVNEFQLDLKD